MTREDVAAEARTWLGTPWHHGQHLKGVGTDCIGFVFGVACALGLMTELPAPIRGYGRHPNAVLLYRTCDQVMRRIPKAEAGLGDVLVLRFETDPQHFGIITGLDPTNLMHAHTARGGVVEHGLRGDWPARVLTAYRMPGVV